MQVRKIECRFIQCRYALISLHSYVICTLQTFCLFMPMYVYITQYCFCRFHSTFHTRVSHSLWKQTFVYVCDIELILIVMSMYVSERENCHFRKYIYRKIQNFFCVHISCSFIVHFFKIKKNLFSTKYFV